MRFWERRRPDERQHRRNADKESDPDNDSGQVVPRASNRCLLYLITANTLFVGSRSQREEIRPFRSR